jgi:hypothetical protein
MDENGDDTSSSSSLRATIQYAILKIVGLTTKNGDSVDSDTASAVATLTELTLLYATQLLAPDLQQFRRHAGKSRITEHDVLLVIRRSPENILSQVRERLQEFTNDKAATRAPPTWKVQPRVRPKTNVPSSSSDSSTASTVEMENVRPSITRVPKRRVMETKDWDTTSSEEDERILRQSKLQNCRRNGRNAAVSPRRPVTSRFRLVVANEGKSMPPNNGDSSSEEEEKEDANDAVAPIPNNGGTKATNANTTNQDQRLQLPKTTQQYLANLSQDSLLSEEEDTRL